MIYRFSVLLVVLLFLSSCQGLIEADGDWMCGYGGKLDADGQCVEIEKVENAWYDGKIWHCDQGYRKQDDQCIEVENLENAWFDGAEWHCNSGFKMQDEQCVEVAERANAWFDGDEWVCNAGFMEEQEQCVVDPDYDPDDHDDYPE